VPKSYLRTQRDLHFERYRLWLLKNSICLKTDPKGVNRNVSKIGENRL
jgi:hypothetical protein